MRGDSSIELTPNCQWSMDDVDPEPTVNHPEPIISPTPQDVNDLLFLLKSFCSVLTVRTGDWLCVSFYIHFAAVGAVLFFFHHGHDYAMLIVDGQTL